MAIDWGKIKQQSKDIEKDLSKFDKRTSSGGVRATARPSLPDYRPINHMDRKAEREDRYASATIGFDTLGAEKERAQKSAADTGRELRLSNARENLARRAGFPVNGINIDQERERQSDLSKELQGYRRDIERIDYIQGYQDVTREDNFVGQFRASYDVGQMGQDEAMAWKDYLSNPTPQNRLYAEAVSKVREDYMRRNQDALDDDATLPWITQDLAQYLPQLKGQTIAGAKGALGGAAVGTVIPVAGTAAGAKAGYVAGRAAYGFDTMQGFAFKALLDAGLDEQTAREAAMDEAFISSLIEGGDAAIDLLTLGGGKVISALFKKSAQTGAKITKPIWKQILSGGAAVLGNALGEGVQEWVQEGVSLANQKRGGTGALDLIGATGGQVYDALSGRDPDALAQMNDAGAAGFRIGLMVGGGSRLTNAALESAITRANERARNNFRVNEFSPVEETSPVRDPIPLPPATQSSAQQDAQPAPGPVQPSPDPMKRVYDLLGDSGKRSIVRMYDGTSDMDIYAHEYIKAYQAGLTGGEKPVSPNITEAQSTAAYFSGQNDAQTISQPPALPKPAKKKAASQKVADIPQTKNSIPMPKAETGKAFTATLYHGSGADPSEIYVGTQYPVAGKGRYYAMSEKQAKAYGDTIDVESVTLKNPIVVRDDTEWRALTDAAGWQYPNMFGMKDEEIISAADAMRKYVMESGHDGLVIQYDDYHQGDINALTRGRVKTLDNVFGHDQVIVYGQEEVVGDPVEPPLSMLEPSPFEKSYKAEKETLSETAQQQIADSVKKYLEKGTKFSPAKLFEIADKAYGGTMAQGTYTVKDAYDGMELAVNQHLMTGPARKANGGAASAKAFLSQMEDLLSALPTQTKRTAEMESYQQFSTPPNIAYLAAWTANVSPSDVVLEPSAGIGGLALWPKAWGATVYANELSDRRLQFLNQLGLDGTFNLNAEQIDNLLPDNIKPTVVIMNPPFSSTAGRTATNKTANAKRHIEQALERLEPDGRLVAILGRGMSDNAPAFRPWWNDIKKEYNVRANIQIDGSNYKKYGTTFDVQMVVIDKNGPTTGGTITGVYKDLSEIPELMEGIRNDRQGTVRSGDAVAERAPGAVSVTTRGQDTGHSSGGTPNGLSSRKRSGGSGARAADRGRTGKRGTVRPGPEGDQTPVRGDAGRKDGGRLDKEGGGPRMALSRGAGADLDGRTAPDILTEENIDSTYSTYAPQKVHIKGAKPHPAKLVESAAMAAVEPPDPTYTPALPERIAKEGILSDAQLENVVYAGQAHAQTLPDGRRKGFFIGDGTGVGKGRQIAGIIMDNFIQGCRKAVWISEKASLLEDAKRDWKDLGGNPDDVIDMKNPKLLKTGIQAESGIVFAPYTTLRSQKEARLKMLEDWLGKDFDGVIALDEAHNMGNSVVMKRGRGRTKPAAQAIAGIELQKAFPNARVVYASATGATDISQYGYLERLGLWGKGTAFNDLNDFIEKISNGGLAAMELVARDMKSMGVYMARSISYDDVKYDTIQHDLTPMQTEIYNTMSRAWQKVLQNVEEALKVTGADRNGQARGAAYSAIFSGQQRFYNQILTSMSMPSVIADMKKELAAGRSVVLQLTNTNEAQATRAIAKNEAEGGSLDDIDLTPSETLRDLLQKSFPVNLYEEYTDEDGRTKSRMVTDGEGNPVLDKKAVRMRDRLIAELGQMKVPDGPLEMLFDAFGPDQVAEVTGRTQRVVEREGADGVKRRVLEKRGPTAGLADTKMFQDGKKRILVFSEAGGTGKSYHADLRAKNQQQRVHYLLQAGWNASKAVQGFGRTHRSNQASAPIFRLVTTNVMGQKRFTSTIARRLDQLGALTKGQRQAGSGVFSERDNLENPIAMDALSQYYKAVDKDVLKKLGLYDKLYDEYGRINEGADDLRNVSKFLNRILSLEVDEQNEVFQGFYDTFERMLDAAIANGTVDMGLENYKADKIDVVDENVIRTDKSGADTKYVQMVAYKRPDVVEYGQLEDLSPNFVKLVRLEDGSVRAVYEISSKTNEKGEVERRFKLLSPQLSKRSTYVESTLTSKTTDVPKKQWKSAWEAELKKVPEFEESTLHILTGTLLPIWNRLPDSNTRVMRVVTADGRQYLGRVIPPTQIDGVLRGLGSNRTKKTYTAEQISEAVLSQGRQAILQDNRMKIVRRKVSGEWRMEVTGQNLWYLPRQISGIITERINYEYRYFIPTGASGKAVLQDLIGINPVLEIRAGEPEVDQMVGRTGRARGDGLQGKPGNDTMGEIERSLKEDQKNGEAREETRESFLRRAAGEGYAIFEGKTAAYGYRRPVQLGYEASSEQVRRELKRLGITGIIVDGSVIWNQNGLTKGRVIKEATTAHKEVVFINGITTLPPRNVAGHEAFHLWKNGAGKDAYIEALEDNLLFASQAFLKYQEQISKEYLGGEADLADDVQLEKLREELFAYISGDIHEGTNDDLLRPMFRDYDAVKAAWESLVRENTSTKETEETEFFSRDANVGSDQWTTTRVGDRNVTPKTLSEIFEDVRQKFGINITTGHVRGAGVKGTYNRRTEGVRTKIANDLPTLSHEIGHHLDNMYGLTDNLRGPALSELVNNLGDDMRAAYSKKKWKTEGLAEFVRKFLQNREVAAIDYPEFTKYFMETLTGSDAALVYQLADEINAYFAFGAQSAAGNIRFREEKGPDGRTLAEKIREKGDAVYQAWVDANHGIKRFDEAAGSEVYKLAANSAYSDAVAANIIVHDLRNQDGQYVGPGLSTVLSGINLKDKTEYRAFGEYLVVKHGPERLREGMRVFADDRQNSTNWMKARQAELEEQYPQFAEASDRLYEFQRSLLQTWGVETGLVSQDSAEQWGKRWKYYVPLNRAMGDKRANGARRGYANQNSTIKRAKGSGRDIVHPVDNVINNMVAMVNAGVRNNVMRKITDTAMRKGGLATFLEQVPTPIKQKKFNAADLKRGLSSAVEESSLSGADKDVMNEIISNIDDILIQYGRGKAFGDVVTVMKGGKPEFWKINDTGLLQSITSMNPTKMDGILDAYAVVSRFITGNITGKNLLWSIFSNAPRDLMTFFTYSKDKNPLHVFGSMGAAYVNKLKGSGMDPLYAEYLAMGGGQTSAYTADRNLAKKARKNMTGSRAEWLNPLEWIAFTSDMIEMGPRFATYKMMRQKGMNPQDAFYEAMDITVNFRRGGRLSRELNKVVPFFNASVQGLDKFSRWVRGTDAPRVERGKVVRTRMIAYLLASAALAALFYGINNGDDDDEEDYQQLSNFTKNTYWLIPLGDGKYFAIPKPRELAVLASFFETCMEALAGENPHAFDEFFDYLADNAAPPVVSDLVKGDWQGAIGSLGIIGTGAYIMANRDFLGKPIESAGLSNLEPKDRYNERTSQIAKAVGEALNVSPQKVDYFFNAVFGGFWKTQKALFPVGGESVDKTLGIQNTYIKDNQYSTDLVNWLYDQAELSEQKSNSDPNDMDKAIQKKMDSNMTSFYSRYYALSKNVPETTASRGTRQLVLDMIREYQKATEQGSTTRAQEIVYDVCRESGSTKYLPSAVQQSIKDTNGVSHTLSDAQYVEYQTDYLRIYWGTVESAASMSSSMEERKEAILSAKSVAEDAAKSRVLKRIGVRAYDNSVLDTGTLDLGEIAYFNSVYINTGSDKDENGNSIPGSKQDKIIDFMEGMNLTDEEWNYLWHSVYTSDKNNPRK